MVIRVGDRRNNAYLGVEASNPPQFVTHDTNPNQDTSLNFNLGTLWLNQVGLQNNPPTSATIEDLHVLVDIDGVAATWRSFSVNAPSFFTGDTGGPVGPDANGNVNLLGSTNHVTTTGSPGTNTITFDIGARVLTTIIVNTGGPATGSGNATTITGGNLINTSASGNNITINFDNTVAANFTADTGMAVPVNNNLNVVGDGTYTATAGAGDTVTISHSAGLINTYTTDAGTATPLGGNINIVGTGDIDTSGSGDTITITSTSGSQFSGFLAFLSTTIANATGNAIRLKIPFDQVVFDKSGEYDPLTGFFTATAAGQYCFTMSCTLNNAVSPNTAARTDFEVIGTGVSVGIWAGTDNEILNVRTPSDEWRFCQSVNVVLAAGDTIGASVQVDLGPQTVGVVGAASSPFITWFSGVKIGPPPP